MGWRGGSLPEVFQFFKKFGRGSFLIFPMGEGGSQFFREGRRARAIVPGYLRTLFLLGGEDRSRLVENRSTR